MNNKRYNAINVRNRNHKWFLFLFVWAIGCSPDSKKSYPLQISYNEIEIPINTTGLSTYYSSDSFEKNGHSIFIGYNYATHAFDLYDLENETVLKSVTLQYEGADGLKSVGHFAANKDYIVVTYANSLIILLNHEGEVLRRISVTDIPNLEGLSLAPMELTFGNFSQLSFDNQSTLTIPIFKSQKRLSNEYYSVFYIMELSFEGAEFDVSLTKCKFPQTFQDQFYGDFDIPYVFNYKDELIYNFPISSSVFRINPNRDNLEIFELPSNGDAQSIEPLSENAYADFAGKRFNYFFNSARYFPLVHDRFRELYYLVRKEKTEGEPDRYDKNILMIFDKNLSYLDEVKLDSKLTPIYGVVKEGLYFLYNQQSIITESFLPLVLIDINVSNIQEVHI